MVSEERGEVCAVSEGALQKLASPQELDRLLEGTRTPGAGPPQRLFRLLAGEWRAMVLAVLLASLIWILTFMAPGSAVRMISAPVGFENVPPGMEIAAQSAMHVDVECRGASWLIDGLSERSVLIRLDLRGASEGMRSFRVKPDAVESPPGVVIERVSPATLMVTLRRKR